MEDGRFGIEDALRGGGFDAGEECVDDLAEVLGFFDRGEVGAVLERDRLGISDAVDERPHSGGGHLVVAPGGDEDGQVERLFISVRTVESHVSSLLAKLHVTTRVALAACYPQAADPATAATDI